MSSQHDRRHRHEVTKVLNDSTSLLTELSPASLGESTSIRGGHQCHHLGSVKVRIHLKLKGTFSCFQTRPLNLREMEESDTYPVVYLTPDSDEWDPNDARFAAEEDARKQGHVQVEALVPSCLMSS